MKAPTWRSVSGGIAAFAAIVVLLVVVMTYARTGRLRGETFRLFVAVPDANNLLEGSDVWLNGRKVGTVDRIRFAPPSAPLDERVVIEANVLTRVQEQIRLDSRASLRSGGTVIGAPVVYLTSGTPATRAVAAGDTIRGLAKSDFEIAASRATSALEEVPAIVGDAKVIMANARTASARLRGIMSEGGPGSVIAQGRSLRQALGSERGTAGRLLRSQDLRQRVERTMAATDTLRALLSSRATEVGRFRRDSTLGRTVESLRADMATLRALAASPNGTVGRITTDSALVRSLDSAFAELSALIVDLKKNPLRYARVF